MNPTLQRASGSLAGFFRAMVVDGPWKSKSVLAALTVVIIGMSLWVSDVAKQSQAKAPETQVAEAPNAPATRNSTPARKPVPGYVRWCASYIGGFFLGWGFRRFFKLAALVALLAGSLIAMTKFAGCDTAGISSRIERNVAAVQENAVKERTALKGMLPSATAATIGAFLGFCCKSRHSDSPEPQGVPKD
jgi:hypothetical protein